MAKKRIKKRTPRKRTAREAIIFDVYATDGRLDENYYVLSYSLSKAAAVVEAVSHLQVESASALNDLDRGAMEEFNALSPGAVKQLRTKGFVCYDSGT